MTSLRTGKTRNTPKAIEDCHVLLAWMLPEPDKFPCARCSTPCLS